jgi:hypothetical protein
MTKGVGMEERELLRMIAFTLKESAERITALANEAHSELLRGQLFELSRQLMDHAAVVEDRER